ncbi:MAG: hypothetical protein ABJB05_02155 [Parafilimonas sp.]
MSKEEIKYEINKVLEHFSDEALNELLMFLKDLDEKQSEDTFILSLKQILEEDFGLLSRLAQ